MKRRSVGLGLAALAIFAGLFYLYGGTKLLPVNRLLPI